MLYPDRPSTSRHSSLPREKPFNTPAPVGPAPLPKQRNLAIDFTKGSLILLMVIYHWGNYFIGSMPYFYDVLRFLTPAFIFITGTIVSVVYIERYRDDLSLASRRLATRGAKLVLLFTALNLGLHYFHIDRSRGGTMNIATFTSRAFDIYVSGDSYQASFRVLLPIGYLLLLSIVYFHLRRWHSRVMFVIAVALGATLQILEIYGVSAPNFFLISFGFFGLAMDRIGIDRINALASRPKKLVLAYFLFSMVLLLTGTIYCVQVIGVGISLLLLYCCGQRLGNRLKVITRLGSYSLFAYIFQIGILQAIHVILRRFPPEPFFTFVALGVAVGITISGVLILHRLRHSSPLLDLSYRVVFS